MPRYLSRPLLIALLTTLIGSGIDYFTDMETEQGLEALFQLRGNRAVPEQVLIVAMDEQSEARLGVTPDLTQWRGLHAQLIKQLKKQGAALIVFDLQFVASHAAQDRPLAEAMRSAGNVLLAECVQKLRAGVEDFYGRDECSVANQLPFVQKQPEGTAPLSERLIAMRKISATPLLLNAALDHAPFDLSNDAASQTAWEAWTFVDALAEAPTLPVVAWVSYLHFSKQLSNLPELHPPISTWLTTQRRICRSTGTLSHLQGLSLTAEERRLAGLICGPDSQFINYYGPPRTLPMVSYSDVYNGKIGNLKDKVVFVGKANRVYASGKTDYFPSPFSDTRTGKMAGVEIMASHFANLLTDTSIKTFTYPILVCLAVGVVAAWLLNYFSGLTGIFVSLVFAGSYLAAAVYYFENHYLWLPIVIPLFVQLPLTWVLALLWSRRDLLAERKRILAFIRRVRKWRQFIPSRPGEWYPEPDVLSEVDTSGVCLATDIENYTSIAANHSPHEIWELLNAYYEVLGHPVSSHKGMVTDVAGDSMIAVWLDRPADNPALAACSAALEMQLEIAHFNEVSTVGSLPTRIGLYQGAMTLGEINTGDSSHYRAIGDTVNLASRIQGVNKYLGTQILACAEITIGLTQIIWRPVGKFRVLGREEPLSLVEIIAVQREAEPSSYSHHALFAEALKAFQAGAWANAIAVFQKLLDNVEDAPSRFYLNLALAYRNNPPASWDGAVTIEGK